MNSSRKFLQAWRAITAERSDVLLNAWDEPKKYTSLILDEANGVLRKVADTLGLLCYARNYYHPDAILYSDDDFIPERRKNEYWFRSIKVAFEHENKYNRDLNQEIGHLLLLNAGLRVVVAYPKRGRNAHLDYFHSIIKGTPQAVALDDTESFLLILGYPDPLAWEGLVFKQSGWKEIDQASPR